MAENTQDQAYEAHVNNPTSGEKGSMAALQTGYPASTPDSVVDNLAAMTIVPPLRPTIAPDEAALTLMQQSGEATVPDTAKQPTPAPKRAPVKTVKSSSARPARSKAKAKANTGSKRSN